MSSKKPRRNNPVLQALAAAPVDDEPTTGMDREAIAEAREERKQKRSLTTDQLKQVLEIL